MNHSNEINEIACALSKAQSEMGFSNKDSKNPFFNSKYSDLSEVWDACRPYITKQGLSVTQIMGNVEGVSSLITILLHSSGQWIKSVLPLEFTVPDKIDENGKTKRANKLQLLGSCITYLRRYELAAIVGITPKDDDDANSSGKYYQAKEEPKQEPVKIESKPLSESQVEFINFLIEKDIDKEGLRKVITDRYESIEKIKSDEFDKVVKSIKKRQEKQSLDTQDEEVSA